MTKNRSGAPQALDAPRINEQHLNEGHGINARSRAIKRIAFGTDIEAEGIALGLEIFEAEEDTT